MCILLGRRAKFFVYIFVHFLLADLTDGLAQNSELYTLNVPNQRLLWTTDPLPLNTADFYNWSYFGMTVDYDKFE